MTLFEVTMLTLQRYLVQSDPTEDFTGEGLDTNVLDRQIRGGAIIAARVPRTVGDDFPVSINAAHIISYVPSSEELKPRTELFVCTHDGEIVEVPDPSPDRRDDTLKFWKCLTCEDTFPLVGDSREWKPKPIDRPVT